MKKSILLLLTFLIHFTTHTQWQPVYHDLPKNIAHIATIILRAQAAYGFKTCLENKGKKIPYLGNDIAARIIVSGLAATYEQATTYEKKKNSRTEEGLPSEPNLPRLRMETGANILLKIAAAGATEYIIDRTKYLLHKCSDLIPFLDQKYKTFQKEHPTISTLLVTCAEETYRANIGNTFNAAIDQVTHDGNENILYSIGTGLKNARFNFVLFSYES